MAYHFISYVLSLVEPKGNVERTRMLKEENKRDKIFG